LSTTVLAGTTTTTTAVSTSVTVRLTTTKTTSTVSFSAQATETCAIQLLKDGGFETGSFTPWIVDTAQGYTASIISKSHSGSYAASFSYAGGIQQGMSIYQKISVCPGKTYAFSGYAYSSATGNCYVAIVNSDSQNYIYTFTPQSTTGQYVHITGSMTYTAGANTSPDLLITVTCGPAAGYIYLDDLTVTLQ
jgi:hypothetical protein